MLASVTHWLTDNIIILIDKYESFGVLVGFLVPFLDAFLAIFPLFVVVVVNVKAFGFWPGSLISWLGSVVGTLCLFFLLRRFGKTKITKFLYRPDKNHPIMNWIDRSGFGPIFVLLCFPFTPSFFINIFAAFSKVNVRSYVLAVILGKFVMIISVSWIGHDIQDLLHKPLKAVLLVVIIFILWLAGKWLEKSMSKKENVA